MYQILADIYDCILGTDADRWADYVTSLDKGLNLRSHPGDGRGGKPILLDLGCGTGSFCLEMAKRGYDPIGIDGSPAMLSQAQAKMTGQSGQQMEPACLFLDQDITRFELYGTVDLAVCLLDTLNHLTRQSAVQRLLRLAYHYLNPGGLFVCDLISRRQLSQSRGNRTFVFDEQGFTLIWQNHYHAASMTATSAMTLFQAVDGTYVRSDEWIRERYYPTAQVRQWARSVGFEEPGWPDLQQSGRPEQPCSRQERVFLVLRKPAAPRDTGVR